MTGGTHVAQFDADRLIVFDTETTGLSSEDEIIEVGAVELCNRRLTGSHFHVYCQPRCRIHPDAQRVHGITHEFLSDKPRFEDIVDELMAYLKGATLVIHNAEFDLGFMNAALKKTAYPCDDMREHCGVIDSLLVAREKHSGQRNTLDALCKRYGVDSSGRDLHGALLDAQLPQQLLPQRPVQAGSLPLRRRLRPLLGHDRQAHGARHALPAHQRALTPGPAPLRHRLQGYWSR